MDFIRKRIRMNCILMQKESKNYDFFYLEERKKKLIFNSLKYINNIKQNKTI